MSGRDTAGDDDGPGDRPADRPDDGATDTPAAFDLSAIDDVIHGKIRLAAMAFIAGAGKADFASLKRALQTTDGNLSVHMRKLEDAGYVTVEKTFHNRRPLTTYALSEQGVAAWKAYLDRLAMMVGLNGHGG